MENALEVKQKVALKKMPMWQKILTGMILGVLVGSLLGPQADWLKPIGTLFINSIKMLIVPLVFCSLIVGITSMQDTAKMGRVGLKSTVIYLLTTAVAISIGLALGTFFGPGEELNLVAGVSAAQSSEAPNAVETLIGLIPTNPINALATGNILQIIIFAIALGVSLVLIGEKADPAVKLFNSIAEAMYKLTELVMSFAPIGVFALMAWLAGNYGLSVLLPLVKVIGVVYLGCFVLVVLVYSAAVGLIAKLNPLRFLKGIIEAQMFAFSIASSSATLPVSMRCAQENLGISKGISSFVLPLGATINMDGTAMYQGVCVLFIAQAFGVDLTLIDYATIVLMATLASIGTAGVPGAGLIMLSLILTSLGLPMEGVAIIAGIDRILDMARTSVNVCGDLMVSVLVGNSEEELDHDVYNGNKVLNEAEVVAPST